ncbi:MAG: hypothetical protein ABR552_09415 [Actinomycetota bacterium]
MMRKVPLMVAVAVLIGSAVVPVAATPVSHTLYLHSVAPVGNVEEVPDFASEEAGTGPIQGPSMDEQAPSSPVTKTTSPGPGNTAFRKNVLLGWWQAPLHGVLSNASVHLWAVAGSVQ